MEGTKLRNTSLYDGEAREVLHVKHVSELISKVSNLKKKSKTWAFSDRSAESSWLTPELLFLLKVLYKQKWEETKDRYSLPPDAPELVLAVKNAANYSKVGPVSHPSTSQQFNIEPYL